MTQPASSPHIEIRLQADVANIQQHRPAVLTQLAGMGIEQALRLVPTLLPICGAAQSIAAARAVAAARGEQPAAGLEIQRERQLAREQALSCGWRLAVDWPDLLGEPREMAWLKQLRGSETPEQIAELLNIALGGIAEVNTPGDLASWAGRQHCVAARVLHRAISIDSGGKTYPLSGEALEARARSILDGLAPDPLAPIPEPVEVGPLAMARDPLVGQLDTCSSFDATSQRIAALLLDCRHIARAGTADVEVRASAWNEEVHSGSGRAGTARGPVFHRVTLDDNDRVEQWRSLAPTDWHFAASGPVAANLAWGSDPHRVKLLVAGFDPCVPCYITGSED